MKLIIDTKKDSREDILKAIKFLESFAESGIQQTVQPQITQDSFSPAGFDMFNASPQQNVSSSTGSTLTQPVEPKQSIDVVPMDNIIEDIFAGTGVSSASAEIKSTDEKLPKTKVIEYY